MQRLCRGCAEVVQRWCRGAGGTIQVQRWRVVQWYTRLVQRLRCRRRCRGVVRWCRCAEGLRC